MSWAPDYATTAQVKAFLGVTDSVDDTEIATAITAASRAIDRATSRQFGKFTAPTTLSYEAVFDRHAVRPHWTVTIDDLASAAGLTVSVGGVAVTDYTLEPVNAVAKGRVFTSLRFGPAAQAFPTVTAPQVDLTTDQWGWSATPATVLHACKLQSGRFHKRRDALFGVAGSPADGSEVRLLAKLDPDVAVMLVDYTRLWAAAATQPTRYGAHWWAVP